MGMEVEATGVELDITVGVELIGEGDFRGTGEDTVGYSERRGGVDMGKMLSVSGTCLIQQGWCQGSWPRGG